MLNYFMESEKTQKENIAEKEYISTITECAVKLQDQSGFILGLSDLLGSRRKRKQTFDS
jgi:hypothetical protein